MSVYTSLTNEQVTHFLSQFELGELCSYRGIEAGIENTNYFVTTTKDNAQSDFVLTLFEHHGHAEVREFIRLAHHLGNAGLSVPAPLHNQQDEWLHTLADKPAILCHRLAGEHISTPSTEHCGSIGQALAELHLAAQNLENAPKDGRGYEWWFSFSETILPSLNQEDQILLRDELTFQTQHRDQWLALPHGWMHGDLFHDNALFVAQSAQVGAILDLYNACQGAWLYDLAVVANDWCSDEQGNLIADKQAALLSAYQSVRPFEEDELESWQLVLRGAALRFWLSRIHTQHQQAAQQGEMALVKDPNVFRDLLIKRRGV